MATATTRVLNLAELLDGILLYIHEDYKTLRSTSLVARNWRFGSQSLLLHSASLSNDRYPLFWEILEESSVMASNIVNFTFRSLGLVRFGHMKGLLVNLGRLPRLANLKVSGPFWDDDVEDTMIPQMALLNRLTIARSDFHTTRVLQALLAAWSSIGHLQIMRCHVRPGEVYEAARGSVTISKLETTCTHDSALSAIAAVLCVNSPRSLVATCRSLLQLHDLRKMLLRIGQNVHHFDMKFGPNLGFSLDLFDNLTSVQSIRIIARKGDLAPEDKWPLVTEDLPQRVASSNLAHIECDVRSDEQMYLKMSEAAVQSLDPDKHTRVHTSGTSRSGIPLCIDVLYEPRQASSR